MTVIPDSITPVEGWRTFRLDTHGHLNSIHYPHYWVPKEVATARCATPPAREERWEIDRERDGSEIEPVRRWWDTAEGSTPVGQGETVTIRNGMGATVATAYSSTSAPVQPSGSLRLEKLYPPAIELPIHLRWFYRERFHTHEAPLEECTCGIYMAKDLRVAAMYLRSPSPFDGHHNLIGKIYGWGNTIEGEDGYRVQYAYPTELYVNRDQANAIEDYGVPLILDRNPGEEPNPDPDPQTLPPDPDPDLVSVVEGPVQPDWIGKLIRLVSS